MNRNVHSIASRLSLRPPQRDSLEILSRIMELIQPNKSIDLAHAISLIEKEYPSIVDFERDFPSCALPWRRALARRG